MQNKQQIKCICIKNAEICMRSCCNRNSKEEQIPRDIIQDNFTQLKEKEKTLDTLIRRVEGG